MTTIARAAVGSAPSPFGPTDLFRMYLGIEVPDPITFVVGEKWCNRPNIYPRQATLLKIIFLRDDLFTDYDNAVIDEWEENFKRTGNNGIVSNVRFRIRWLKRQGYKWFREVLLVMGRRAGKGHVSALAMAYVLWNYMAKGDPQGYYGVDRDKRLSALIFAGKRDQAKATVFGDLYNVITGSTCFAPYLSETLTERLSIYAPYDFVRIKKMTAKGLTPTRDMATFEILPKESTPMAGRGPTSFQQCWDEMAHVVTGSVGRDVDEVYKAAKPSLDQFGKDAFICEPSSPWQMSGKFYENWLEAIGVDEYDEPRRPNYLMIQLASWDIYIDWERAYALPMFPEGFQGDLGEYAETGVPNFQPLRGAIQVFDDEMAREKAANPETFAVERESHWAASLDAYLNERKVAQIFEPWEGRLPENGPAHLSMQKRGIMIHAYKGHADPSKVNDKYGYAVAHAEPDAEGRLHCVFDLMGHFRPMDFEGNIIDYEYVDDWIWENIIKAFTPEEFTYDQYNSPASIQKLQKQIRGTRLPKRVNVFEKTVTRQQDWAVKESSKAAINLGLVHAPYLEQAELELRFLQLVNGRVDHPSSGPIQSKDIADAMMECIDVLIGEQTQNFVHSDLRNLRPGLNTMGEPFSQVTAQTGGSGMSPQEKDIIQGLSGFSRARGNMDGRSTRARRARY